MDKVSFAYREIDMGKYYGTFNNIYVGFLKKIEL